MSSFAIAVLSYNHPEITEKCITSIYKTNYAGEIYLLHNGSLEKNIIKLRQLFPDIHHSVLEKNVGYSGGANSSLAEVFQKYETCLFLTNDTELLQLPQIIPDQFSSVQSYKRKTEDIDSISGLIDLRKGRLFHRKKWTEKFDPTKYIEYIPGTAFWMTKNIFNQLGGFDESFHTYWEDVDLSYRAQLLGLNLSHSHETVLRHKIGKTCHKDDFYTYYLYQRNRKKFMLKHHLSGPYFWFFFFKDLFRMNKTRFQLTWKIIND